jgi:hypothetical protein
VYSVFPPFNPKSSPTLNEMCYYSGIFYLNCGHTDFELKQYCPSLRYQLDRTNKPEQLEQSAVPFDLPNCDPKPRENVTYWTINKLSYCGRCYCDVNGCNEIIGVAGGVMMSSS